MYLPKKAPAISKSISYIKQISTIMFWTIEPASTILSTASRGANTKPTALRILSLLINWCEGSLPFLCVSTSLA